MNPKVSIQIPTYNQQNLIKRTIESCLMQDYDNLEINISDDCSTDDTSLAIQYYLNDHRVKYYKNQTNLGRVGNYRKALYEYATGEWAINLDGDDYLTDKYFISNAIRILTNNEDQNILVFQANHNINKIKNVLIPIQIIDDQNILVKGDTYFLNYYKILHFYHCATIYKRSEALKLNFYSFNCLFSDFNSIAKLFINGNIVISNNAVAHWSKHDFNESSTLDGEKIKQEIAAMNELAEFAKQYLPIKNVIHWKTKMNGYLLSIYYDMQKSIKQKRIALKLVVNNFSFDRIHIRQLVKAILGAI